MPEHPDITAAIRTGYPRRPRWPRCPVCGSEFESFYYDANDYALGCDRCVQVVDYTFFDEDEGIPS